MATSEVSPLPPSSSEVWADNFTAALQRQRDRLRAFLAAQQERLKRADAQLSEQLKHLADDLAQSHAETSQAKQESRQYCEQLTRQIQGLQGLHEELTARQADWQQLQQRASQQQDALLEQVRRQQEDLQRRGAELQQRHTDEQAAMRQQLEAARQRETELTAEVQSLRERCERLAQQCAEASPPTDLDEAKEAVRQQSEELARQIESLQSLRAELTARQADWEQLQQRGSQQQEALLEQVRRQQEDLEQRRTELQQRHTDEQTAMRQQLDAARQHETELTAEVHSSRERCDQLAQQAEASLPADPGKEEEAANLRRRYDMALDDLRELKARNAELQQQVAKARAAPPQPARPAGGALDWESQKRRILDALEADSGKDDPQGQADRPKIEAVLQTTEQALAEKDREIGDLKQLLENQSTNLGAVAVGAAALGEMLDKDAIVQEERESLKRLQEQWREKLRQAEIEISLERAALARERAQTEEKLHLLAKRAAQAGEKSAEGENAGKPLRGRWRARLGLKEPE